MPVNAALRCTGNLDFVQFLFEPIRTAGRKLDSAKNTPGKSKTLRVPPVNLKMAHERDVANTRLGSAIDFKTFGPLERAVNDRHVQLQADAIVEVVADECLRDRTVEVLADFVVYSMAIDLQRPEVSELFGHTEEQTFANVAARLVRRIDRAQIARGSGCG